VGDERERINMPIGEAVIVCGDGDIVTTIVSWPEAIGLAFYRIEPGKFRKLSDDEYAKAVGGDPEAVLMFKSRTSLDLFIFQLEEVRRQMSADSRFKAMSGEK
jgi:hypothetical protein